ncbi:unnamed protein product, partial [marine sediment metagenome]
GTLVKNKQGVCLQMASEINVRSIIGVLVVLIVGLSVLPIISCDVPTNPLPAHPEKMPLLWWNGERKARQKRKTVS